MTQIFGSTTAEADARLVTKDKDVAKAGFTLVRAWPYIDATLADTLSVTLDAIATYGPTTKAQADGQEYDGTFVNSKVRAIEGNSKDSDRSVTLQQTLIKVDSPANATALAALDYTCTQDNEILDLFALEAGEGDRYACVWNNINPSQQVTLIAVSDASLVTAIAPAAGTWSYKSRRFQVMDDGTARFIVVFEQNVWTADWATDVRDVSETNASGVRSTQVRQASGIDTADLDAQYAAVAAASGYELDTATMRETGNGKGTVSSQETKENAIADAEIISRFVAANGTQEEAQTVIWYNLSSTPTGGDAEKVYKDAKDNSADMTAATYEAAPAGHLLKYVERRDHPNNILQDIVRVTFKPDITVQTWLDGDIEFDKSTATLPSTVTIHVKNFSTSANAEAFLDQAGTNLSGTQVNYMGRGRWKVTRVRA